MKNTTGLDWNDLKYFLAVARSAGLTPAAAALQTGVATVSRHIDTMEAQLGLTLFLRSQSGYQLTDQGTTLFAHVEEVERAMLAMQRHGCLLGRADELVGLVRLATSEMLANSLIAPDLYQFMQRHPHVNVELIASRDLADLSRREADLALRVMYPNGQPHHADYIAHDLGPLPFALYGTPELVGRAPADAWRTLPYLSWGESSVHAPQGEWLANQFPASEPLLRANSMQALTTAARTGLGLALLPCYMGDAEPGLVHVGAHPAPYERQLWLVYHRDLKSSRRVLAMRDFIVALVQRRVAPAPG